MAHTSVGFQCRSATPCSSHRIRGLKPAATILDRYAVGSVSPDHKRLHRLVYKAQGVSHRMRGEESTSAPVGAAEERPKVLLAAESIAPAGAPLLGYTITGGSRRRLISDAPLGQHRPAESHLNSARFGSASDLLIGFQPQMNGIDAANSRISESYPSSVGQ